MKFKLIQFATLLIFVMSLVYMAQVPNVFGHDASEHEPQFYVSSWEGTPLSNKDEDPCALDPRDESDFYGSSGNGSGSASSWALRYYASPMISGGHASDDETNYVFGARIDFSASAGNSSCSGSILPTVTMDMGLTSDFSWGGNGRIKLSTSDTVGHIPQSKWGFSWCTRVDCPGGSVDEQREVEIRVSSTEITDKQSGDLEVSLTSGEGSVSAKYTVGTDVQRTEVHAYPYGFSCTLKPTFWTWVRGLSDQMDKKAEVSGFLTEDVIDPADIYAEFDGTHDCPGSGSK